MRKILSALAAFFVLCLCAAAIENSSNENRAGEAKPTIDYREEMRRFVIAISQYGKKFDKNFIVIPQNGLELITEDGSASGELQQGYLRGRGRRVAVLRLLGRRRAHPRRCKRIHA